MKNVADATTKLQRSLGSTANKECEEAIDAILDATGKLDTASLQELQVGFIVQHFCLFCYLLFFIYLLFWYI